MDHVTMGDRCTINNSIISSNVYMTNTCSLSGCQVGKKQTSLYLKEAEAAAEAAAAAAAAAF
jgi:hypothetical protein